MSSGLLTSSSRTSGTGSSLEAERSVMRRTRPKLVSTTSAPAAWACRATSNAIDSRFTTPVINSFLSCSRLMSGGLQGQDDVVTPEAERVGDRERGLVADLERLRLVRHVVEVQPFLLLLVVEGRRS